MNLEQLQRTVFDVVRQPLTADERMRPLMPDGKSTLEIAEALIKPNDRLTSAERLEIYNRVYWFRIFSSLADDFPGLRAVIGQKKFDAVLEAYLSDCPSESFTLRNLGSQLEIWLLNHREFVPKHFQLAHDIVRLEWAEVEAFDSEELPRLSLEDLQAFGESSVFALQPYLHLLDLSYPADDLLLRIRNAEQTENDVTSNVVLERAVRRRAKRSGLPRAQRTYLAVHRQKNAVYFKRLEPASYALLYNLQQGKTLSEALEASLGAGDRSVEVLGKNVKTWFSNWASLGWFCNPQ